MSQVFLYLPFRNAEHAGQLIGGHPSVGQKIDDALTECAFKRQHVSYRKHEDQEKPDTPGGSSTNHLKSCALKGCTDASNMSKSVPASIVTSRLIHWADLSFVFLETLRF